MLELEDIFTPNGTEYSAWRHYLLIEVEWRNEIKHKRVISYLPICTIQLKLISKIANVLVLMK